jgi:hypothetical protein
MCRGSVHAALVAVRCPSPIPERHPSTLPNIGRDGWVTTQTTTQTGFRDNNPHGQQVADAAPDAPKPPNSTRRTSEVLAGVVWLLFVCSGRNRSLHLDCLPGTDGYLAPASCCPVVIPRILRVFPACRGRGVGVCPRLVAARRNSHTEISNFFNVNSPNIEEHTSGAGFLTGPTIYAATECIDRN